MKQVAASEFKAKRLAILDKVHKTKRPVQVTRRVAPSIRVLCERVGSSSRSSTGAADVRECGASPTEYSLRFKSSGLWSSRASTAGATQGVGKRGNKIHVGPFHVQLQLCTAPLKPKPGLNEPPSITVSALSRDTSTVEGFDFPFVEVLGCCCSLLCSCDQGPLSESCGGIWFHQPSIRSLNFRP
jgi:hypothetical protein